MNEENLKQELEKSKSAAGGYTDIIYEKMDGIAKITESGNRKSFK